jgi:two-component system, OmpR family, copper resistance phosphate regulon response regulator CusR
MVEDAGPVLDVLRESLERAGFEVDTARTATAAVELLATWRYAVIVADCFLPDLPPLDWLAAMRGAAPGTPLVLYSGTLGLEELRDHATGFGAAAVLEKPFAPAQLVAAVREAVAKPPDGGRSG